MKIILKQQHVEKSQIKLAAPAAVPEKELPTEIIDVTSDVLDVYQALGGKNYLRMLAGTKPTEFIKLLQMAAKANLEELQLAASSPPPTEKPAILRITNFAT